MKAGDLVRWAHPALKDDEVITGIVISVHDEEPTIPPAVTVLWGPGEIAKEWSDELAVVDSPVCV